jgi:hypothetical protein
MRSGRWIVLVALVAGLSMAAARNRDDDRLATIRSARGRVIGC